MVRLALRVLTLFSVLLALGACATTTSTEKADARSMPSGRELPALRIGVTPNYPPIIFESGGQLTGVEVDLARKLGDALGRQVQFVQLQWDNQIPALLEGRTDIVMSGVTVTKAREVRVSFTEPYLRGGLLAAMRLRDAKKFDSVDSVMNTAVSVGVVSGTTSEAFVRKSFRRAVRVAVYPQASDGIFELKRRTIDLFVYDAPAILWLVSENESEITALWKPLNEEYLAWAVRPTDEAFLAEVNRILLQWKQDGQLRESLLKWLPLLKAYY